MRSLSFYESINDSFVIPELSASFDDPTCFTVVLVTFLLFILASVANPLIMFYQLNRASLKTRSTKSAATTTTSLTTTSSDADDDLEMSKIIESNNANNSKQQAKPPEDSASQASVAYASNRIIKAPSQAVLTVHQKARRLAYGIRDDSDPPRVNTKDCYTAIFYECRFNQLMNREPFLLKPRIGSTEMFSGVDLIRKAANNSAMNYINQQHYKSSFFNRN